MSEAPCSCRAAADSLLFRLSRDSAFIAIEFTQRALFWVLSYESFRGPCSAVQLGKLRMNPQSQVRPGADGLVRELSDSQVVPVFRTGVGQPAWANVPRQGL